MEKKIRFRFIGSILACAALMGLSACVSSRVGKQEGSKLRQRTLIDADWRFHRGDVAAADRVIQPNYDDASWQRVNVPHDYVLDGTYYCSTNKDVRGHGYLPLEVAWYRKHLFIPQSGQGKILQLEFGGIYRDSQVWLNGQLLGRHPTGYTTFFYDITKIARCGQTNVITVRVDPRQHEGWWYEGGGIYRHVYLTATAPLHVANYGTYVISKVPGGNEGASAEADLTLQTTVENDTPRPANCGVVSEVFGPDGVLLKTVKSCEPVDANAHKQLVQHTVLLQPRLWSLESPALYKLRTTVLQEGKPVDCTTTTFGIRTIHFDADKGFFLNGKHVEIHGVANHQDFPVVGIAVPDSLQPWRVKRLKEMGCNGWRTAHNEPNEEVLDACDRLGMLVMAENRHLGDSEGQKAAPGTTATNFSDLATMIQRDRNHPSIIFWSLSNEEKLEATPEGARIHSAMKKVVRRYDPTRPVSCAMVFIALTNGVMDVEDIIGVNYNRDKYDQIHKTHPHQAMYCSEGLNQKSARCNYMTDTNQGWASAYNLSDKSWQRVASRPFMAGAYVWTGFDYRGEPNPFGWPDISNNTGLLDVCGFPKDKGYYFKVCWSDKPMVHLMPMTWNWPGKEGEKIRVIAFSNARQVELFLNGQSHGVKKMPRNGHVEWKVPYAPGRLVAKACTDGHVVATDQVETTDAADSIQLSPDRTSLHADGVDALVVPVSILDDKGRLVDASNRVSFQLSGGARILGVANGNPSDHDPDRATRRNAFHGHCIVLIQAGKTPGPIQLTASSPGLKPASITLQVE